MNINNFLGLRHRGRMRPNVFSGGGSVFATVNGQGYFYGGMPPWDAANTGSGANHVAGQLGALLFFLPFGITVRNAAMNITVVFGAGVKFNLGIYTPDKNTKLIDAQFDANVLNRQIVVLGAAVTLQPGFYWFVWGPSTGAVATGQYFATPPGISPSTGPQGGIPIIGTAANPSVAGVLPATLGVITISAATIMNAAVGIFYP